MTQITFTKMHGLGNNYVYIDGWKHLFSEDELPKIAKTVSQVTTGIGSDGLILIGPSEKADVRMRIFNKDGSEGKNCGNGIRCVAKYAYEQGYVKNKTLRVETGSGNVEATITSIKDHLAIVSVNMGPPRLARRDIPMLGSPIESVINEDFFVEGQILKLTAVSMGNPHAVFFVPKIEKSAHMNLGPVIEHDARFPERTNVEFIAIKSAREIDFRVWERGSGPTEACGTGACAAVVAAVLNGYCQRNEVVTVHLPGGDLEINWTKSGDVLMTGPAETVAQGIFFHRK